MCKDSDFDNLIVHEIGLAVGIGGDDYTFCKKCWGSADLGKKILELLEYPNGIKFKNSSLEFVEIKSES